MDVGEDSFRYKAFISYSHKDTAAAKWLHRALETWRTPKALLGTYTHAGPVPKRLYPIFRDTDELPTSSDLGDMVEQALRDSAFLIVLCSAHAAKSRWVNEEIRYFKSLGRANRILCIILDGEPHASSKESCDAPECFPDALRFRVDEEGQITDSPVEPIAADLRPGRDSRRVAKLRIVAGLLGIDFAVLLDRERARNQRRLAGLVVVLTSILAVVSVFAVIALQQRNAAITAREVAQQRTNQLEKVVSFQSSMLSDISIEQMGVGLRNDVLKEASAIAESGNSDEQQQEAEVPTLAEQLAQVNFTNTAVRSLDQNILQRALAAIERDFSEEPFIQAILLHTVGESHRALGMFNASSESHERSLELLRAHGLSPNRAIIPSLTSIGNLRLLEGRHDEAEAAYDEALEVHLAIFGEEDPDSPGMRLNLANLLHKRGDLNEARKMTEQIVQTAENVLGV